MASISCRFVRGFVKTAFTSSNLYTRSITTSCISRKIFKIQDEKDFQDMVVNSDLPVVIDFQASWCGPCKILEPRLEIVIGKHHDKVHLAKVDIDTNAEIAMEYNVTAVPHVLGYRNGEPQESFIGVRDEDQIESFVNELIGN